MFDEPSPRRLAHIGGVCLQWSYLELLIGAIIWKLLNLEIEVGKIVTGGLDILPRLNMAINLCRELKADKRIVRALVTARKQLQDGLLERRNMVVHGQHWLLTGEIPLVEVQRGKGTRQPKPLPDGAIYDLVEAIGAVSNMIGTVLAECGFIDNLKLSELEKKALRTLLVVKPTDSN